VAVVKTAQGVVRFEGFALDLRAGELCQEGGKTVHLPEQPFRILLLLLEHPREVVTREELRKRLWPDDTIVEFEHSISAAMNRLRQALGDSAENPRYIETLSRRGYRWMGTAEWAGAEGSEPNAGAAPDLAKTALKSNLTRWGVASGVALLGIGLAVGTWTLHSRKTQRLTEKDTVVLADFTNATGDTVFDDGLKEGLRVQLRQSPFLNLLSEEQTRQLLGLMNQPSDARLTPRTAREICQRSNGAGVLEGSITRIGTQYDLIIEAVNCSTGESLASTEA